MKRKETEKQLRGIDTTGIIWNYFKLEAEAERQMIRGN